jgi:Fur family transcriptional regulator, zinc uptake regulator
MTTCHNHQHCINDALKNARLLCQQQGAKLTPLREQVLRLIWQSHQLLGAYDLIDMLAAASERRVAPPTVYRALDFLLGLGMIHRINALNAYIGCPEPARKHPSYFLICTQCHTAKECNKDSLNQQIVQLGDEAGFVIQDQWLEVLGTCQACLSSTKAQDKQTVEP